MKRLQKLRILLQKERLDALLISDIKNITYFTGFTGSVGMMFFSGKRGYLLVDGRYAGLAKKQAQGFKVVDCGTGKSLIDGAVSIIKEAKNRRIGFDDNRMTVMSYQSLTDGLPGITFLPAGKKLDNIRAIKDGGEIHLVKVAARIVDSVHDCIKRIIKVGMSEMEVANEIDYLIRTMGAEASSFYTLVSSGKNTAHPHGKPTDKVIKNGDIVQLDFGAAYKGYSSDISRVLVALNATGRQKKIHRLICEAQSAAIKKIRDGVRAGDVDKAARDAIEKHKMGKYFTHGTGHGLGLAIHEAPRVSLGSRDILRAGMILTVEPGIYIPGWGGIRVEDMVLVTKKGCEVLTRSFRGLEVFS